jgi:hypothetical protein
MANAYQGQFPIKDTGDDGFAGIAPTKSFPPNAYGLYDMAGNVWQRLVSPRLLSRSLPSSAVLPQFLSFLDQHARIRCAGRHTFCRSPSPSLSRNAGTCARYWLDRQRDPMPLMRTPFDSRRADRERARPKRRFLSLDQPILHPRHGGHARQGRGASEIRCFCPRTS